MLRHVPRPLLVLCLVLFGLRVAAAVQHWRNPPRHETEVRWRGAAEAEAEAQATGRPLLYDFGASWCRPCERLSREVFADPELAAVVNSGFIPVRVENGLENDGTSDAEARVLRERHGVQQFPTLLVVSEGKVLGSQVGYPGFRETEHFLRRAARGPR